MILRSFRLTLHEFRARFYRVEFPVKRGPANPQPPRRLRDMAVIKRYGILNNILLYLMQTPYIPCRIYYRHKPAGAIII